MSWWWGSVHCTSHEPLTTLFLDDMMQDSVRSVICNHGNSKSIPSPYGRLLWLFLKQASKQLTTSSFCGCRQPQSIGEIQFSLCHWVMGRSLVVHWQATCWSAEFFIACNNKQQVQSPWCPTPPWDGQTATNSQRNDSGKTWRELLSRARTWLSSQSPRTPFYSKDSNSDPQLLLEGDVPEWWE